MVDPASGLDETLDLAVDGQGGIAAMGRGLDASAAQLVVDAEGLIASPGLIDPHVHLREPAPSPAETIEGATTAAVRGGFTTVVGMPNTTPPIDTPSRLRWVLEQARRRARCRVF
ncbi:MAG: dihydroorotase, partial [Planctomycetota bacterium]